MGAPFLGAPTGRLELPSLVALAERVAVVERRLDQIESASRSELP
jgi:hypothetical protein